MDGMIEKGTKIQKHHVYDGTAWGGKPKGPVLEVLNIKDHNPVDGPSTANCIAILSDGSWEFVWNITEVK